MQDQIVLFILIAAVIPNVIMWGFVLIDVYKRRGKIRAEIILPERRKKKGYFEGVDGVLNVEIGGKGRGNKSFTPHYTPTSFIDEPYFFGLRQRKILMVPWGADHCFDFADMKAVDMPKYSRNTIRTWYSSELFDLFKEHKGLNIIELGILMISVVNLLLFLGVIKA